MVNGTTVAVVESTKRFDRAVLEQAPESLEVSSLGEGLKLVKRESVELDHDLATGHLNLLEFGADRPLNNAHVLRLMTAMKRGTFMPEQVMLITCTLDGKEYRMNGQHTCWARLEMPANYRCPVQRLRYRAETENDMRRLYASIDRMKGRSGGNVVCSYLFDTPEWAGFSKATVMKLAEAIGFWLWENDHQRHSRDGDDRAYLLMTTYYKLGRLVGQFVQDSVGESAKHIRRRPVIAAMLATFSKGQGPAIEFWTAVRDGVGFGSKTDPRLVLRNNLVNAAIGVGMGAAEDKKSVDGEEMYRWCIYAWNTWRRDEPLKQLKAMRGADRPRPI